MRDGAVYLVLAGLAVSAPAWADESPSPLEVDPILLLQTWATVFDQDLDAVADPAGYGDPDADIGLGLRRARAGLGVRQNHLEAEVTFGVSAPFDVRHERRTGVQVVDAWGGGYWALGPGELRVAGGSQKVPVSRELLASSTELPFQERAVQTVYLAPVRDLGVVADYELDLGARLRLGAFNGGGDLFGDDNPGLLGAARLEFAHGDTYRTFDHDLDPAYGVALSAMFNDDVATRTTRYAADALVRLWFLTAMVEGTWSRIEPVGAPVTSPEVLVETVRLGGLAYLGAFLPLQRGGVELGVRAEIFDDNTALRDQGDVALVTLGASWRDVVPGVDLGAGFIQRMELGGRDIPNNSGRLWLQAHLPTRAGAPALAMADTDPGQ